MNNTHDVEEHYTSLLQRNLCQPRKKMAWGKQKEGVVTSEHACWKAEDWWRKIFVWILCWLGRVEPASLLNRLSQSKADNMKFYSRFCFSNGSWDSHCLLSLDSCNLLAFHHTFPISNQSLLVCLCPRCLNHINMSYALDELIDKSISGSIKQPQ